MEEANDRQKHRLFQKLGAQPQVAADYGLSAAAHFAEYEINTNLRLAHFMAQICHESGDFRYQREIWGPTTAQKGYEGRRDLGNVQPGDGHRFMGRGPLQCTGRNNYAHYGKVLSLPLEEHPEIAETPAVGLLIALAFWKERSLNAMADNDDGRGITRRINGGFNGLDERLALVSKIKGWMA